MDSEEDYQLVKECVSRSTTSNVVILEKGSFYRVFDSAANFICSNIFRSSAMLKRSSCKRFDYMNMNINQYETTVKALLTKFKKTVTLWNCKGKSGMQLVARGSPGNFGDFEDLLIEEKSFSNYDICYAHCLTSNAGTEVFLVGFNYLNSKFCCQHFIDENSCVLLEVSLLQFGAKELLLSSKCIQIKDKINEICTNLNILLTEVTVQHSDHTSDNLNKILNEADLQQVNVKFPEVQKQHAVFLSLNVMIKHLNLDNFTIKSPFRLTFEDPTTFVQLDAAALRALHVFPEDSRAMRAETSLFGLLNRTVTKHGMRALYRWLSQPLTNVSGINERLDVVEAFIAHPTLCDSLSRSLKQVTDLELVNKRFSSNRASLTDCVRLYQSIDKCALLSRLLNNAEFSAVVAIESLRDTLATIVQDFVNYKQMIDTVVNMDVITDRKMSSKEFYIRDGFDEQLDEYKVELEKIDADITVTCNRICAQLGIADKHAKVSRLDRNMREDNSTGWTVRLTKAESSAVKGLGKRFEIVDSSKNAVKVQDAQLRELSLKFLKVRRSYNRQQKSVEGEVIAIARGYSAPLTQLIAVTARLDVLLSFAQASTQCSKPYIRPRLVADRDDVLNLVGCRHPCLERVEGCNYIANSVAFDERTRFVVITGPNMGGKSTYLRSVGCCVLLAQIGCFIPADTATLCPVDKILARLGASDCLAQGMSTFMTEMLESSVILKQATSRSLVLIDELGRGTSTYDGFGLAYAISERLANDIRCFGLFATHLHEVTRLGDGDETAVKNVHVSTVQSEDGKVCFLYEVREGACNRSFGVDVAAMCGIPSTIVNNAKRKLAELEQYDRACDRLGREKVAKLLVEEMSPMLRKIKQESDAGIARDLKRVLKEKAAVLFNDQ